MASAQYEEVAGLWKNFHDIKIKDSVPRFNRNDLNQVNNPFQHTFLKKAIKGKNDPYIAYATFIYKQNNYSWVLVFPTQTYYDV